MQDDYFWEVPVQFDNPRRLTITLTFPAPGNTEVNEIAVNALKHLVATAKTPEDMHDKVLMAGTPHESACR